MDRCILKLRQDVILRRGVGHLAVLFTGELFDNAEFWDSQNRQHEWETQRSINLCFYGYDAPIAQYLHP